MLKFKWSVIFFGCCGPIHSCSGNDCSGSECGGMFLICKHCQEKISLECLDEEDNYWYSLGLSNCLDSIRSNQITNIHVEMPNRSILSIAVSRINQSSIKFVAFYQSYCRILSLSCKINASQSWIKETFNRNSSVSLGLPYI